VVLAAVSAGPDSTALVAALAALRDAGTIARVLALHVDHGLRPGGADDAACAAAACARLAVPFESVRVRVAPGNVQAQARRARYAALRAAAARAGATRIATGHTRTDQAETVLLRLVRGAGARGRPASRGGFFVRPLIDRCAPRDACLPSWAGPARGSHTRRPVARNRPAHLWPQLSSCAGRGAQLARAATSRATTSAPRRARVRLPPAARDRDRGPPR
jgi:tRNA(Ile)-lysidine synthase